MTNREKFEKVFGMKMDLLADDPCNIVDDRYCSIDLSGFGVKDKKCSDCEMNHFWDKEYIEANEDREEVLKAFHLGVLFGTVATSDEVLSMVMKELNMEEKEENEESEDDNIWIYKTL